MSPRKVEVVKYRKEWKELFKREKELLESIFQPIDVEIHHIGSTSVPGLSAKPIIDILLIVDRIEQVESVTKEMEASGYEAKEENGLPGRPYFQKSDGRGVRQVHLHAYTKRNLEVLRHLAFRDYLMDHPEDSERYGRLKEEAAAKFEYDIDSYTDEKSSIVKEIEHKALEWKRR